MKVLWKNLFLTVAACIQMFPGSSFGKGHEMPKFVPGEFGTSRSIIFSSHLSDTDSGTVVLQSVPGSVGSFLTDAEGRSLYIFKADSPNTSTCYGACAQAWPPLIVPEGQNIVTAGNVVNELIGKVMRSDGTWQVTYNGMPLYHFSNDKNPGDITGQGITDFGALWYLVRPEGTELT